MLEALSPPFQHAGVRFLPTGGVNLANLERYLRLDSVAAAGGSWLANQEDLARGHWDEIRNRCRTTLEIVAQARRFAAQARR
jgi:2-dehydro-3-deoxyphosphogluconate aldolase/(4S)-4-hydroxy-2-oxoglutarate aldolase